MNISCVPHPQTGNVTLLCYVIMLCYYVILLCYVIITADLVSTNGVAVSYLDISAGNGVLHVLDNLIFTLPKPETDVEQV